MPLLYDEIAMENAESQRPSRVQGAASRGGASCVSVPGASGSRSRRVILGSDEAAAMSSGEVLASEEAPNVVCLKDWERTARSGHVVTAPGGKRGQRALRAYRRRAGVLRAVVDGAK